MPYEERKKLMADVERRRSGRTLVTFFNFDRDSVPEIPGLYTEFNGDAKEPLFAVLKEIAGPEKGIDLFIYTHGGHVNAVWPIVSLIREFDPDFEVLVPYACHSAGTFLTLGAKKIVLAPLSELSPIDPTGGNQFNPVDEISAGKRLGINVEDLAAYRDFILRQFEIDDSSLSAEDKNLLNPFMQQLTHRVHPLALGGVHRVQQQGRRLACELLSLHNADEDRNREVVDELSSKSFSHMHMINRHEAKKLLPDRVEFADEALSHSLDALLRQYEKDFALRTSFVVNEYLGTDDSKDARFIGAAIESQSRSYLRETKTRLERVPVIPPNINLQLQPGQKLGPIQGLPVAFRPELIAHGWVRNNTPLGITT